MSRIFLLTALCLQVAFSSLAQDNHRPDHDTTFYRSYKGSIILRTFLSRNYSQFNLAPPGGLPTMKYRANTPLNFGAGINYRFISVSVSRGLNFLRSGQKKGDTHSFDLLAHLYKPKWAIDVLAQFYRGYFLGQPDIGSGGYYLRPDMGLQTAGATAYRVLNDRRFSYGAGLSQNALQEKSAGSILIGGEAFYTAVHGDSSLAPYRVDTLYNRKDIRKLHLFDIGPGIGYAYTFVLMERYFLLGSVNVSLNAHFSREIGSGILSNKLDIAPQYILRFGAGYNTPTWGLSAVWFASSINAEGESSGYKYTMRTGSYRLVYACRLAINRKMKKILEP
jgi:hypothetical protein